MGVARIALALAVVACAGAGAVFAEPPTVVRLRSLERTWRDTVGEVAPFGQGDLTVTLSSPSQYVTLREVVLELTPDLRDGGHRVVARVEFLGRGQLIADLAMGGVTTRLEDQVTVPLQIRSVEGRVLLRVAADGIVVTPLELPADVEVEVRSGLAERLVGLCGGMSLLAFGAIDCDRLEADLARVRVPLPPAGEPVLVPIDDLAPEEIAALTAYLVDPGR